MVNFGHFEVTSKTPASERSMGCHFWPKWLIFKGFSKMEEFLGHFWSLGDRFLVGVRKTAYVVHLWTSFRSDQGPLDSGQ